MKKLQAYQKTYLEFQDDSPSATPKDSFDTLDFNQYDASLSGEVHEVQSSAFIELKGGNTTEEVMGEQIVT